ncbi:hypothetical protein E4K67_17325 [Desulfosporosinus fructosivorans]|uniref:Uncharacterized protein n=1 Tax=Desulfosporosinus fructosivorans TaxID=2018669 RepID=A0A4Z0R1H4_9FIRM|nr:hypothetical protein [Desulfosporosinus fructosivorans]TGE36861.1 hypothetical protein E4K67_17325 [Desulfosporosinus fructosivorans]
MKWNEQLTAKLKELCIEGKTNAEIADVMRCKLTDVYAKRSQLGITIAKCKGIEPNLEFEKALETSKPKGMRKSVRDKFKALFNEVLMAMASDWTSVEDSRVYANLSEELIELEAKYNTQFI